MMAMAVVTLCPSMALLLPPTPRFVAPRMMAMSEQDAKKAWLAKLESNSNRYGGSVKPTSEATRDKAPSIEADSLSLEADRLDAEAARLREEATRVREAAGKTVDLIHAPLSYFDLPLLSPKGTRRSQGGAVDIGEPEDFSRPLVKEAISGARVGSWACTAGGWDSPKLRPTTETFLVLDGTGSVTDKDGMRHPFGPGDVVVLPKHWCGRWDITSRIHKVWVVHDHPDVPGAADGVVRAVVAPVPDIAPGAPMLPVVNPDKALYEAPANIAQTIYDVGPTKVGFLLCAPGSFVISERADTEIFFVVEGTFFLTSFDGASSRRCAAGDTVVVPKGWSGFWDVVEPVRKVWVEVE